LRRPGFALRGLYRSATGGRHLRCDQFFEASGDYYSPAPSTVGLIPVIDGGGKKLIKTEIDLSHASLRRMTDAREANARESLAIARAVRN
jgi:hypothetical protein